MLVVKIGQWLGLIALVTSLYNVWQIRQLLLLGFTAIILATALNSFVRQLQRLRIKRDRVVLLTIVTLIVLAIATILLIVPSFIQQFTELIATFPIGITEIKQRVDWNTRQIINPYLPSVPYFDWVLSRLQPLVTSLPNQVMLLFGTSINVALEAVVVLMLTLMLLISLQPYRQSERKNKCISRMSLLICNHHVKPLV